MNSRFPIIAILVLMGRIMPEEADILDEGLIGQEIPASWRGVVEQFENIIGRKLMK